MTPDPERTPARWPKGVREILLVLAGLAAPVGAIAFALWFGAWQHSEGNEPFLLLVGSQVLVALVAVALLTRRRARWFAIPCAIVSAGIVFLSCSCWAMFNMH